MLDVVRRLPDRFPSREDAAARISAEGFAPGVAQWMSANLVREGDGFVWRIDFDAMERLLRDFFTADLWSVVERPPTHLDLHFLKASQSSAMSDEAVRRLEAAASTSVHLHHREGGHWIHAEAPEMVAELLTAHLPR